MKMRIFTLNKIYSVVCKDGNTRSGFKHTANLMKNGYSIAETKICYLNRTWERFSFESVLLKIIYNNFTEKELIKYIRKVKTFN